MHSGQRSLTANWPLTKIPDATSRGIGDYYEKAIVKSKVLFSRILSAILIFLFNVNVNDLIPQHPRHIGDV